MCLLECCMHVYQGPFGWQSHIQASLSPENDIFINIFWAGLSVIVSRVCLFFLMFQGITFDEFRSFFQFLNNLEDFAIAMQMYNFAARSIGQGRKKAVAAGAADSEDVFVLRASCATSG